MKIYCKKKMLPLGQAEHFSHFYPKIRLFLYREFTVQRVLLQRIANLMFQEKFWNRSTPNYSLYSRSIGSARRWIFGKDGTAHSRHVTRCKCRDSSPRGRGSTQAYADHTFCSSSIFAVILLDCGSIQIWIKVNYLIKILILTEIYLDKRHSSSVQLCCLSMCF